VPDVYLKGRLFRKLSPRHTQTHTQRPTALHGHKAGRSIRKWSESHNEIYVAWCGMVWCGVVCSPEWTWTDSTRTNRRRWKWSTSSRRRAALARLSRCFEVSRSSLSLLTLHCVLCDLLTSVIFRSTHPSRLNKVGLKCPSAHPCPSSKTFFDFNEIRYVGRDRWVMHDGMQYDPILGQGHEPVNVRNSAIFKGYLLPCL